MTLDQLKTALQLKTDKHDQFLALGLLTLNTTAPMGTTEEQFRDRAIKWALSHDDVWVDVNEPHATPR